MELSHTSKFDVDSIKLVQLTDTHLFAPSTGSLLSINTQDSFHAVVEGITQQGFDYEAILATGDISQDHSAESYQKFEEGIKPLLKPCYWLPGNHDYKPNMSSVMPSAQIQCVEHVLLGEHWQMVMLDSQVVGVPHGRLSDQQLDLLDSKLAEYPDRHTLVLLHHHPLLVGSAWLDQHSLKDAAQFWEIVTQHTNVRGVLCGHVHQDMNRQHKGVQVIATPSTCVQFKPNSDDFALDTLSPGWREIELNRDGSINTLVQRLACGAFSPDFNAEGY